MLTRKELLLTVSTSAAIAVIMIIVASFTADVIRSLEVLVGAFCATMAVFATIRTAKAWRQVQLPFLVPYIVTGTAAYCTAFFMMVLVAG